jgi:hypothetical protein
MAWAAKRKTTRKEEEAYCLLGIFNIYMPLTYGEGSNAMTRLRRKINKSLRHDPSRQSQEASVMGRDVFKYGLDQSGQPLVCWNIFSSQHQSC